MYFFFLFYNVFFLGLAGLAEIFRFLIETSSMSHIGKCAGIEKKPTVTFHWSWSKPEDA